MGGWTGILMNLVGSLLGGKRDKPQLQAVTASPSQEIVQPMAQRSGSGVGKSLIGQGFSALSKRKQTDDGTVEF